MNDSKIAIVGGGLGGLSLLAGIVRAAIDQGKTGLSVTIFEPNVIGPGLAYDTRAPDAFKLNHELDFMGSVNIRLRQLDAKDFFKWVREHRVILASLYSGYDLTNPGEYVPRSLYGKYLQVRYEEVRTYATEHGIRVHDSRAKIDDITKAGGGFAVTAGEATLRFDIVVLTTGNYFNPLDVELYKSGRYFRPSDYDKYVSASTPDAAVMLIAGSALFAYDAALYALESGKYQKVIMTSRRAMLRKVRGHIEVYDRQYLTLPMLEKAAGGADQPFRVRHVLSLAKQEAERAYGHSITWKDAYRSQEVLDMFRSDLREAKSGRTLHWRSIMASIPDAERHQIYARLHDDDKQLFVKKYASLYNLFLAPMPDTNAQKLQRYIDDGRIELVNGMRSVTYLPDNKKFELWYAQNSDGTPAIFSEDSVATVGTKAHPLHADVYVDARGVGRDITHVPLYKGLIDKGLAVANRFGGLELQLPSYTVMNRQGAPVRGLYAIGQVACGETSISHNSLHMSQLGLEIGANIVAGIRPARSLFAMGSHVAGPDEYSAA